MVWFRVPGGGDVGGGGEKGGGGGGGVTRDSELIFNVMKLQLLLKIVTFTAVNFCREYEYT